MAFCARGKAALFVVVERGTTITSTNSNGGYLAALLSRTQDRAGDGSGRHAPGVCRNL